MRCLRKHLLALCRAPIPKTRGSLVSPVVGVSRVVLNVAEYCRKMINIVSIFQDLVDVTLNIKHWASSLGSVLLEAIWKSVIYT